MFLIGFPLLIIPLAIYNMIVFLTPGVLWTDKVATVAMPSQAEWAITFGDVVIASALFLLFIEALKASRAAGKPMLDHFLSMLVFLAARELRASREPQLCINGQTYQWMCTIAGGEVLGNW